MLVLQITGTQPQPQYAAQLFAAGGLPLPTKAPNANVQAPQPSQTPSFNAVIGAERPRSVPPRGPSPASFSTHAQPGQPDKVVSAIQQVCAFD